jgi:hypothetical protein
LHSICEELAVDNNSMSFWDKLSMYLDAVGVSEAGTAWDLAGAPMPDNDHRDFAMILVRGQQ